MEKQKIPKEQYRFNLKDFLLPVVGGKRYALRNPESPDNPELERRRWIRTSALVFFHTGYLALISSGVIYAAHGLAKLLK